MWRGEGTIAYTDLAKFMGKRVIALPASILYPLVDILWNMRILKFLFKPDRPNPVPWVGDITKLKEEYGYAPKHTSKEALLQFIESQ